MSTVGSKPFLDHGRSVIHLLRRAFASVLQSVGADPDQPQEISRKFGLDKTLTWRIARVVREDDAWEAVAHIPRKPSIAIFVDAMSRQGAPPDKVEALWQAHRDFEQFIETHSGDRETLEMMASGAARKSAAKRLEAFRKNAYVGNSAIWGVHAHAQFSLRLVVPSKSSGMLDLATICGLAGFRRLRSDISWAITSINDWDQADSPSDRHFSRAVPLDPTIARGQPPLLREFCTEPLPKISVIEHPPRTFRYMLGGGEIGKTGTANVAMGWVDRGTVPARESYPGERGEHGMNLSTPAEWLIQDVLLHRDLDFARDPHVCVYSQLPGGPQYPTAGPDAAILPVPTEVVDLGSGPPDTTAPQIERYDELVQFAAAQLGHTLSDFFGYRYRLRYPPIPSLAVLSHTLRSL